jgi:putative phosphoesterase
MKIVVFSDSHGNLDWMIAAVETERPDYIFFLGDNERDGWDLSRMYPYIPLIAVKGNCDYGPGLEDWVVELEDVRFLLTHGHRYGAKSGYIRLIEAGLRCGADVVCFGHTHQAVIRNEAGMVHLFNPGTIGGPYGQRITYGVISVKDGTFTAEIKDTDAI